MNRNNKGIIDKPNFHLSFPILQDTFPATLGTSEDEPVPHHHETRGQEEHQAQEDEQLVRVLPPTVLVQDLPRLTDDGAHRFELLVGAGEPLGPLH